MSGNTGRRSWAVHHFFCVCSVKKVTFFLFIQKKELYLYWNYEPLFFRVMKKSIETVFAAVVLLAVFGLCVFMVAAGADVLSSNYANVPAWLGWVLLSEGFISFIVIIYHAIDAVCVEN